MDIAERQDAAARSLQPSDRDAIRQALRVLRQKIGAGMLFGGEVIDGKLLLTEFIGARTEGLRHLRLASGEGLGGSVLAQGRPIGVSDYVATDSISHENDHLILVRACAPCSLVPYVVGRSVRGVFYAALRNDAPLGDRATDFMLDGGRALGREVRLRDEVDRRVPLLSSATREAAKPEPDPITLAEIRELHANLRAIAHDIDDPAVRSRLESSSNRLAALGRPRSGGENPADALSPREIDVLAQVALGCRNTEIAERLSIGVEDGEELTA